MNMQKPLYTIQFSHLLTTDSQPVRKQRSWNLELRCHEFYKIPKKDQTHRKVWTV